jgi:hypothetical protein
MAWQMLIATSPNAFSSYLASYDATSDVYQVQY